MGLRLCFPALLKSWKLWDSLLWNDCSATCRRLLYCFESVSVILKAKLFWPEKGNSEKYFSMRISLVVLPLIVHFGVNQFDSFTVGCKKTIRMQIRFEFTSGLLPLAVWLLERYHCKYSWLKVSSQWSYFRGAVYYCTSLRSANMQPVHSFLWAAEFLTRLCRSVRCTICKTLWVTVTNV